MGTGKHSGLERGKHPAILSELDTFLIGTQTPTVRKKKYFYPSEEQKGIVFCSL